MKNNIEKFVYDKLKLVRWVQDGFPPINLNEQVSHLVELVNTFCLIRKENEELKAKLETYKKDYESMVAEVLRLSRENSKMREALCNLIKVAEVSTADIVAFENADILDNCIDKAKALISK